jgi:two-component system sensor histidine kinase KdpD
VLVATAVLYALRNDLSTPTVALLYLLPVGLSTTLWGLGPGIVASQCAFLAFNYFFIPPQLTFFVHHTQDVLALAVFLVVAVLISQLVGQARKSLAQAEAREYEATQLYELSTALVGLHDATSIASALADRVLETFQARAVEVALQAAGQPPAAVSRVPPDARLDGAAPRHALRLATVRGSLGEIRLWRDGSPLSPQELQLLNTFASPGARAFEHTLSSQAETRAKVLEESDRLKSALLSSVSHELRTPLATMKAAVSGLLSGEVDWQAPAREDLLAAVEEEVDHLNRLVGNLLDMSRIEAGALKLQRRWDSLAEIVAETLARLRRATEGHRVAVDVPDELPLVPVDHALMEQVFVNLLGNSIKYAPAGSIIQVWARPQADSTLLVQITNQGPHVPAEDLEHIFDKFHRVTAADRVTGTGLGCRSAEASSRRTTGASGPRTCPMGLLSSSPCR